jgi:hypothetical protein
MSVCFETAFQEQPERFVVLGNQQPHVGPSVERRLA